MARKFRLLANGTYLAPSRKGYKYVRISEKEFFKTKSKSKYKRLGKDNKDYYFRLKKVKKKVKKIEEKIEEPEEQQEPEFSEFVYSIKLIYESSRGSFHDSITESNLIVVAKQEPTQEEVRELVISNMDGLAEELGEDFILNIPYNDAVVGLIETRATDEDKPKHFFKEVKYSHTLGKGYRTKDRKTRQSILRSSK